MRRKLLTVLTLVFGGTVLASAPETLTNLAHLDFLTEAVTPPQQAGHSTYRLGEEPELLTLWTYAEPLEEGSDTYRPVGGGDHDEASDTWGQGAYNADDLARAAVVYLRHWEQTGAESSRISAYGLLRTVAYLQTLTPGPSEGNVVLWMQPDGTLNPSAEPVEEPDPSDSGASFWLARAVWAFGEGYAAFAEDDPEFAAFLEERLRLALGALERQVLVSYPDKALLHGFETPSWLIAGGADASSEAVLGVAAYVQATGDERATVVLERLSEGLLLLTSSTRTEFPFGATLPWTGSRSLWHGWGAQMAGALALAGEVLGNSEMIGAARHEMVSFIPLLLAQGGADQGWTPTPAETVQIAYGADAVLQNLLRTYEATGEEVFAQLAGVAGAWYFGNNRALSPMYDVASGRTFDGLEIDGRINVNSGAESTIHGLLSVLALDEHVEVRAAASSGVRAYHETWQLVEAESGTLQGDAQVVTLESAWNGEANWSGGAYVTLPTGSGLSLDVPLLTGGRFAVLPVFERGVAASYELGADMTLGNQAYRTLWQGGAGEPGVSPNEGLLTVALAEAKGGRRLGAGNTALNAISVGHLPTSLDAFLVRPEVARLELGGTQPQALFQSFAPQRRVVRLGAPETRMTAYVYDETGQLTETVIVTEKQTRVPVAAGGFSYLTTR